jgi:flagellar operon protein
MDDMLLRNRLSRPVVTGTPALGTPQPKRDGLDTPAGSSFQSILQDQLKTHSLTFSRHAANRIEERGIEMSAERIERLQTGMELAQQKGLDDALIIMDQAAFIVSAKKGAIITALGGAELKNSVITNISGTVIL